MTIFDRRYDRRATDTPVYLASNGNIVGRLAAKLDRDDWEQLMALFDKAYQAGVTDGSAARAAEIRAALGLKENDQ
jgi:hypothetical protein